MRWQSEHIANRAPDYHQVSWAWMHDLTNEREVIDMRGIFFWHVIRWCLHNQALADIRSAEEIIGFLYCSLVCIKWHPQTKNTEV